MVDSQGGKANFTGKNFEKFIEAQLIECGYNKVADKKNFVSTMAISEKPTYSREVNIGKNIYDTKRSCDFLLYHPQKWPEGLVIEAKWQQVSGSVDEKYPFLVLSIKKSSYGTILLMDGGGYRKGAEKWVRNQVDDKLLHVFNVDEFLTWISQGNI